MSRDHDLYQEFGLRLRAARLNVGMGQDELAKRTGLCNTAVSHFETGTRLPSLPNFSDLSKALRVSADSLLGLGLGRAPVSDSLADLGTDDRQLVLRIIDRLLEGGGS